MTCDVLYYKRVNATINGNVFTTAGGSFVVAGQTVTVVIAATCNIYNC